MAKKAVIGKPAPSFKVTEWVQGDPVQLDQLIGRVVLLEVFQVNCPGCFLYALPAAAELHRRYLSQGLTVIGIATAFEDFDKNTLDNLRLLAETGQVIGETLRQLADQAVLNVGRLPYAIPFPLAMDRLNKRRSPVSESEIHAFIQGHIPNFKDLTSEAQEHALQQIRVYLENLEYHAETFESYGLKGTPSQILVDKQGILREVSFGLHSNLESQVLELLAE